MAGKPAAKRRTRQARESRALFVAKDKEAPLPGFAPVGRAISSMLGRKLSQADASMGSHLYAVALTYFPEEGHRVRFVRTRGAGKDIRITLHPLLKAAAAKAALVLIKHRHRLISRTVAASKAPPPARRNRKAGG